MKHTSLEASQKRSILNRIMPKEDGLLIAFPGMLGILCSLILFVTASSIAVAVGFIVLFISISMIILGCNVDFSDRSLATKSIKRIHAKQTKRLPWRPIQGIVHPNGRDDIYDRYLIEVAACKETLYVGVRHWRYNTTQSEWTANELIEIGSVCADDSEGVGNLQAKACELRDDKNFQSEEKWYRNQDVKQQLEDQHHTARQLAEHLSD